VAAAFAELSSGVGERIDASVAARVEDYDRIDTQVGVDAAMAVRITPAVTARAWAGRGFRAPSLAQLTFTRTEARSSAAGLEQRGIVDPEGPAAQALGAGSIQEETFWHVGAAITVEPFSGLRFGAEAWRIDIDDQVVLSDVLAGATTVAALRNAGIDNLVAAQFMLNGADTRAQGFDLQAVHRRPFASGRLELGADFTYQQLDVTATASVTDANGRTFQPFGASAAAQLEQAQPETRTILTAGWQRGPLDLRTRIIRHGDVTDLSGAVPHRIDAAWLVNLDMFYQATPGIRLSAGVHNLLGEFPDVRPTGEDLPAENRLFPFSGFAPFSAGAQFLYARVTLHGGG